MGRTDRVNGDREKGEKGSEKREKLMEVKMREGALRDREGRVGHLCIWSSLFSFHMIRLLPALTCCLEDIILHLSKIEIELSIVTSGNCHLMAISRQTIWIHQQYFNTCEKTVIICQSKKKKGEKNHYVLLYVMESVRHFLLISNKVILEKGKKLFLLIVSGNKGLINLVW